MYNEWKDKKEQFKVIDLRQAKAIFPRASLNKPTKSKPGADSI